MRHAPETSAAVSVTTLAQSEQSTAELQSLQVPESFVALNDCFNPPPTETQPSKPVRITQTGVRRVQIVV